MSNNVMFILKKADFIKRNYFTLGGILCLAVAIYFIYQIINLDINSNTLVSVLSIIDNYGHHYNLLVVGLVPICLGLLIFGTAILSLYVGSIMQNFVILRSFSNSCHPEER
jgi:hypothetical protein